MKAVYSNPFLDFLLKSSSCAQCSKIAKGQTILKTPTLQLNSKIHSALDVRQRTCRCFGCFFFVLIDGFSPFLSPSISGYNRLPS